MRYRQFSSNGASAGLLPSLGTRRKLTLALTHPAAAAVQPPPSPTPTPATPPKSGEQQQKQRSGRTVLDEIAERCPKMDKAVDRAFGMHRSRELQLAVVAPGNGGQVGLTRTKPHAKP